MDFDEIFEQYFDRIYYKILGVVKNPEDAEDISQEVFISVYKNLKKFRADSNIYTWIYKIAINKIYDFFRKRKVELDLSRKWTVISSTTADIMRSLRKWARIRKNIRAKTACILPSGHLTRSRSVSSATLTAGTRRQMR